jgi:hypothetical protein
MRPFLESGKRGPHVHARLAANTTDLRAWVSRPQARTQLDRIKAAAAEAYIFAYPLVLSSLAAQTNAHDEEYARCIGHGARMLSCDVWRELNSQPIVVNLPPTRRYHMVSLFDGWTNSIRSIGTRVTGTDAPRVFIAGPRGYDAPLAENDARIDSPTSLVRLSTRVAAYSDADLLSARHVLTHCVRPATITPFSQKRVVEAVEKMSSSEFFSIFAHLLENNPLLPIDTAIRETLGMLAIAPGACRNAVADTDSTLENGARAGLARIRSYRDPFMRIGDWSVDDAGELHNRDYLRRAALARSRLCRDIPQDYMRFSAEADAAGDQLDGRFRYRLVLDRGNEPPARGPWFVGTQPLLRTSGSVAHRDGRGRIEIRLQRNQPLDIQESHWLPVAAGPFTVVLHVFWPGEMLLGGGWIPPSIELLT